MVLQQVYMVPWWKVFIFYESKTFLLFNEKQLSTLSIFEQLINKTVIKGIVSRDSVSAETIGVKFRPFSV
jgi:hypothetical protein